MKTILIMLLALAACGDNLGPDVEIIPPDAALDAAVDAPPDACMREPTGDCCALLPDEDAVRACSAQGFEPGSCGVAVCWMADCTNIKLNFCAPRHADAGIDGGV